MAPRIPGFRESMTEQYQRAAALLSDVNADTVGLDGTVRWFAHADRLPGLRMILHRSELGFHFSAEISLRLGCIHSLTAFAQGDCRLGPVECIAQRTRLRQGIAEKRFTKVGQVAVVRTAKRGAVGGG